MASVDRTLAELIRAFPCSYPTRPLALHQVLVVLGAGYEWQGGEVVQRFDSDELGCLAVHNQQIRHLRERGAEVTQERVDGTCPAEHLRPLAAELARTPAPLGRDPYPASTLAPLFNIPQDAAADWVEAAREIASVVVPLWADPSDYELATRSSFTPGQRAYVDGERDRALRLLELRLGPQALSDGGR
ncbi:hypothetical protein F7Q99_35040 [Streptomyces kaniharaensis]|uniref:Uncharacterized protein n=1 Tax=Streptomyces kaniharaensis TaxID=212423 RepID=A0A6N7L3W1_9ACTN|nr:hypothetical protein [Streptomyces kaniharaensis]MQS17258.1 hypothetical protein [Streptomyces kaniharaensis]